MEGNTNELMERLTNNITSDDFIGIAYDVVEEIEKREDAFEFIESILRLMEDNPDQYFGNPGPLVHFMEIYYKKGYEEKLVESLKRQPTKHTIWLLNRIINDSEGERKKYFMDVLENVIVFPNLSREVVLQAEHYKSLHISKKHVYKIKR